MNLAIVDDHTIFREGLQFVLQQIPDIAISFDASNGVEFLEKLSSPIPDLVLMDISMPKMDGLKATTEALLLYPDLKIIALSSYGQEKYYQEMIQAGVWGFLQKSAGKDELHRAIKAVSNGNYYFPPDILRKLVIRSGQKNGSLVQDKQIHITKREKEILQLICQGYSNNEIADTLFISPKTVDNHRTNLLSKTQTKNAAHLVMFAIKQHIIDI